MFLENGEDFKITVDTLPIDYDLLKQFNNSQEIYDDIIDVEFKKGAKKADKLDYIFAVFSGVVTYLASIAIRKYGEEITFNNVDIEKVFTQAKDWYEDGYPNFDADVEKRLSKINKEINNANEYVEFGKDFLNELSFRGLATNLINEYINAEDKDLKIVIANSIVSYVIDVADNYKKTGKFKEKLDTRSNYSFILNKLKDVIKEFSSIAFNNEKFDKEELKKWFKNELRSKKLILIKENQNTIYLKLNTVLINSYVFIKNFCEKVSEHHINSMEGLSIIDFNRIDNERVITRLLGVSCGIYEAFNVADAASAAIYKAKCDGNIVEIIRAFAIKIDIANILHLVSIVKHDASYIREDIDEVLHSTKVVEIKKHKEFSADQINKYLGLNKAETRIMYSLMLHMIEEDIQNTKESKEMQRKNAWKEEWKKLSSELLKQNKLFNDNPETTFKSLLTQASNKQDNLLWLYNIAIELSLFKPYFQLDDDKKKYKGLKLVKDDYMKKFFCSLQDYISYKDVSELKKNYKKYYGYLDNNTLKVGGAVAGAIVLAAAGGGVAFAFAPQIAVALFGGAYPALHGAALVNAALATVGGGALAAGGLGVAGGTMIIAGGGALIGLGTSATTMLMLSSPKTVQNDYAKLLVKCDYVLTNKLNNIDAVNSLQEMIEKQLSDYKLRLEVLEGIVNRTDECKESIKILKKNIAYTQRTNDAMLKLIN